MKLRLTLKSDMVHNTLKMLRDGNNPPVCLFFLWEGGGGGLKGFSLRGKKVASFEAPIEPRTMRVCFCFLVSK